MEENKIYTKPMYVCAICGNIHETVAERMNCEQTCLKKQEQEQKRAAEAKKKEEEKISKTEVDAAFDHAYKLRDKHVETYGEYHYESENNLNELINYAIRGFWM